MSQAGIINVSGGSTPPILTIQGDIGSVGGNTIQLYAHTDHGNAGSTVSFFAGSATEMDLTLNDVNSNVLLAGGTTGITGTNNTGVGDGCLDNLTSGSFNNGVGYAVLSACTIGDYNIGFGFQVMPNMNIGNGNIGIGYQALGNIVSGSYNLAIGYRPGILYTTGTESSNILLNNQGVAGESNVMRLGTQGSGTSQINECFIAGIIGVTVSNAEIVTINSVTGQMGVSSLPISVANGGTGDNSIAAFSLVCGGTTNTGPLQTVADVATGSLLTSGGTGALPSWSATPTITGITFGAGQELSTYTTGTFTPTLTGSSGNPTVTYTGSGQVGRYTQIGTAVLFFARIALSAASGGSGNLQLAGLPFTSANVTNQNNIVTAQAANTTFNASSTSLNGLVPVNGTISNWIFNLSGSGSVTMPCSDLSATSVLLQAGWYSTV
jgi:hypothetical protein